jgi:hypothetical protein
MSKRAEFEVLFRAKVKKVIHSLLLQYLNQLVVVDESALTRGGKPELIPKEMTDNEMKERMAEM